MKMAKASEADLKMAMALCAAFDRLGSKWGATMPDGVEAEGGDDLEWFDSDNARQCMRVMKYLLELTRTASLSRVVFGAAVMLDPENKLVDPDSDTIEHHQDAALAAARIAELEAEVARLRDLVAPHESLTLAINDTRAVLGRPGYNYPAMRKLLEFAEAAVAAHQPPEQST